MNEASNDTRRELTPAQFRRVKELFDEALEQPAASRAAFVSAAAPDDPRIRVELARLLRHEEPETLLAGLERELAGAREGDAASGLSIGPGIGTAALPMPGRVGPYRVLGLLGEGGMGTVYEAEQTEPIRRRVALKLIRPGARGPHR